MGKVKKRPELLHCGKSRNILRNLMLRDFGLRTTHKTSTRELEPIAEANLVLRDHKELVYSYMMTIYTYILYHFTNFTLN